MKTRTIELSIDDRAEYMVLPINPKKTSFSSPQLNQKVTLLNIGDLSFPGNKGLITGSISIFFPDKESPLYRYADREPQEYLRLLKAWKSNKKSVRIILSDTDINLMMFIDNITEDYEEGSKDVSYALTVSESRKLNVPAVKEETTVFDNGLKDRPNTQVHPKQHTVKSGDSLWKISASIYGSGGQYMKIYEANKALIGSNPNKIFPGQQLVIP